MLLQGNAHPLDGALVQLTDADLADSKVPADVLLLAASEILLAHDVQAARRTRCVLEGTESAGGPRLRVEAAIEIRLGRREGVLPVVARLEVERVGAMHDAHLHAPGAFVLSEPALQPVLRAQLIEDGAADARQEVELALIGVSRVPARSLLQGIPEPDQRSLLQVLDEHVPRNLAREAARDLERHLAEIVGDHRLAQVDGNHGKLDGWR
ncbi:MAG TPA: hypothetical protein VFS67_30695 [Polyangiaceae bacterium]|nr:hypothetical protein [Polyangiaceae bacterium]